MQDTVLNKVLMTDKKMQNQSGSMAGHIMSATGVAGFPCGKLKAMAKYGAISITGS